MEVESSLQSSLLSNYNVNVCPTFNGSEKTVIYYTFYIRSIYSFIESTGKFSITGLVSIVWRDPRITWSTSVSPYKFCSRKRFRTNRKLGADDNLVYYNSSGVAEMYIGDLFETTCLSDVTLYPFYSQKCHLEIFPWSVDGNNVRFITPTSQISLQFYTMNGMWELDETYTFTSKGSGFLINHNYLSLPSSCLVPRGLL